MAQHPRQTGVCLVRVEEHGESFLITVRQNPDIGGVSGEVVTPFSEVEPALATVRSFIERFIHASKP
jgi:hypothetical protein